MVDGHSGVLDRGRPPAAMAPRVAHAPAQTLFQDAAGLAAVDQQAAH